MLIRNVSGVLLNVQCVLNELSFSSLIKWWKCNFIRIKVTSKGFLFIFGFFKELMGKHKDKIEFMWKAFASGKKWAFSEIYNQTYDSLYRFGVKYINDEEQIKDIIHDLYYKLWQNRANLSAPRNLRAYLISSLRATIINHLKKNKKGIVIFEVPEERFSFEPSIETGIISRESKEINNKALFEELNNLSSKQKEAIYLHYIQELDYKEIADIMQISVPHTRNLVHQGIKKLKESSNKFVR